MKSAQTAEVRAKSYTGAHIERGEQGEEIVKAWLEGLPQIVLLDDLRSDPEWRARDVDFRTTLTDGQTQMLEVKTDFHLGMSPNVLFEYARIYHRQRGDKCVRLGWSVFSSADKFLLYGPQVQRIYSIRANVFRAVMRAHTEKSRKATRLDIVSSDEGMSTMNMLIPLELCEPHMKVAQL